MSWQSTTEAIGVLAAGGVSIGAVVVAMRANGRVDQANEEARRAADAAVASAAAAERGAHASEDVARIEGDRHHRETAPVLALVHIGPTADAWGELVRLECSGPLVYEVDTVQLLDYDEGGIITWIGEPGNAVSARRMQDLGTLSAGDRRTIEAHRAEQLAPGVLRLLVSCSLDDRHWHQLVECQLPGLDEKWLGGSLMA
ncbi:MAG: hypothetical protein JNK12_21250 [Acidimicrobiales bacterium]|nr:hypothetical protein [Acidimicrobiales bacterium]